MVVVIHGPMGCGKTRNAREFAYHYRCGAIHDGVEPTVEGLRQAGGTHLVLTTPDRVDDLRKLYIRVPGGVRLVPYATAAKAAGVR